MERVYLDISQCCGCSACEKTCSKGAIIMEKNNKGFKYPVIDQEKCVDCGACKSVCGFNPNYIRYCETPKKAYGVKHKNLEERLSSRSGGIFMALAEYVIKQEGVVFGVALDNHFQAIHKKAETLEEVYAFKGSKYIQSDENNTFIEVKKQLESNKLVLYSGTACQVAGLRKFLGSRNIEKLILCDIVCHGVPSPRYWQDYLEFWSNKYNTKIEKVNFRNKSYGWSSHFETLELENGKILKLKYFTNVFFRHYILRESCSSCYYTNLQRPSDFTIADFWGVDSIIKDFNDEKGVSLVYINSETAKNLFHHIKDKLEYKEVDIKKSAGFQPNLSKPSDLPWDIELFWSDFEKYGMKKSLSKYGDYSVKKRIKGIINTILKR